MVARQVMCESEPPRIPWESPGMPGQGLCICKMRNVRGRPTHRMRNLLGQPRPPHADRRCLDIIDVVHEFVAAGLKSSHNKLSGRKNGFKALGRLFTNVDECNGDDAGRAGPNKHLARARNLNSAAVDGAVISYTYPLASSIAHFCTELIPYGLKRRSRTLMNLASPAVFNAIALKSSLRSWSFPRSPSAS
jgi:hypothetical protein